MPGYKYNGHYIYGRDGWMDGWLMQCNSIGFVVEIENHSHEIQCLSWHHSGWLTLRAFISLSSQVLGEKVEGKVLGVIFKEIRAYARIWEGKRFG